MANHKLYTKWSYTLKICKSTKNIKLRCMCSVAQSCPTLCHPMDGLKTARLLWPWNPPGKNSGVRDGASLDFKNKSFSRRRGEEVVFQGK